MSNVRYNSWPLGMLPKEFQRNEPEQLRGLGYHWSDPRDIVTIFENKVAKFANSKYAVAVDCCSHGIFLCMQYLKSRSEITESDVVKIPAKTYVSVPMQIKHAGISYEYEDISWSGAYQIKPTRVWDSAVRWTKGMYLGNNTLQVLSFQIKKRIPIGKGGMILTDDEQAAKWLKLASYDGRNLDTAYTDPDHIAMAGYHMYMTPEDAARGIILMDMVPDVNDDTGGNENYPDLQNIKVI